MSGYCRFCDTPLQHTFVDLGTCPLSNSFLTPKQLLQGEYYYPLKAYVCAKCKLVQVGEFESPEHIFNNNYAYFSSYSSSWLEHARHYTEMMIERFSLNGASKVIEIASNDGYLLQYFKQQNIPVLGIEPATNVATVARDKGIETITEFFGRKLALKLESEENTADVIIGNNVLAHVPNLNDFIAGLKVLLSDHGVITLEFPHLLSLIKDNQFDTIYHEHFSYFSLNTVMKIFESHGFSVFDVEELVTHGGSLRIFVGHLANSSQKKTENLNKILVKEANSGLNEMSTYLNFTEKVEGIKYSLLNFLLSIKEKNQTIVGYGAAAKGNTLLNYCGVHKDLLQYTVDKNPHKQGTFLPGSRIPVYSPETIIESKPDYILILPWNIKNEITQQLEYTKEWGCKLVVAIPQVEII